MLELFTNGFNLGIAAIAFVVPSPSVPYTIGAYLGMTALGTIQGFAIVWFFRSFLK